MTEEVAKLLIIDDAGKYLLFYRSSHPEYPNDPDLPGGMVEAGELAIDGMLREVVEEAGIEIDKSIVREIYEANDYSAHQTTYCLYVAELDYRPEITISWEHSSFEWVDREEFLEKAKGAIDSYMHMVHDVMSRAESNSLKV